MMAGKRLVEVSDELGEVQLSPDRLRAALGLLNWSYYQLGAQAELSPDQVNRVRLMAERDQALEPKTGRLVLSALLDHVEFTTGDRESGVVLKPFALVAQAAGEHVETERTVQWA
jgi:hypothetical protein